MTSFSQLGDPVCPVCPEPEPCLCEHHEAAYAKWNTTDTPDTSDSFRELLTDGTIIAQVPITITERCCVVVNTATITPSLYPATYLEIERPLGTIRTTQGDTVTTDTLGLQHHAAWEVLDAGTYTYYLVNRAGASSWIFTAWIKAIASDCEG